MAVADFLQKLRKGLKAGATTLALAMFLAPTYGQVVNPSGGGSGTVTSVTLTGDGTVLSSTPSSAVTTSGTLTAALANAAQNSVLAGPASGGAAAPSYQTAPTFSAANLTNFPTFNQNTTGSAASLSITGQTGLLTFAGLTSTNRAKTVRDAADTLLELGGSYTPTGTWTSMTLVTPALGTPSSGVITSLTGTCTSCTASNATLAVTATNLGGTTVDSIPYQSASATTSYLAPQATNGIYFVQENVVASAAVAPTLSAAATGTGSPVLATSPTLVTPALGTPASGVITNLTGTCTSCTANSANAVNTNTFPAAAGFTSGGIPYYSSTTAEASSALLTNHGLLVGGGAGAAPASLAVGGANFPLIGQASANPAFSTIAYPSSLTSGSLLYASSTTAIATGSLPTTNALIKGNGAGNAPSGSTVIDDGKNITSTEVFVGANKSFVTSDFTDSTSTTLQLVTGLSFTLPTSKAVNVSFHCVLLFDQGSAAVSDQIGIGVTGTAPTQANASAVVYPSTSTLTAGTLTALASTTPTSVVTFTPSAITTIWTATLDGTVEQPSNATPGVFGVYVATTTGSDNFIVKRGSYCTLF